MAESSITDTAAYRIIRQILDHTRGPDFEVEDEGILSICRAFGKSGGSWERLMDGDMDGFRSLEDSIDGVLKAKELSTIASRVAAQKGRVI